MAVYPSLLLVMTLWLAVLGPYYRTNHSSSACLHSPLLGIPPEQIAKGHMCASLVHNFTTYETRLCTVTQKTVHDSSLLVCTGACCWHQLKLSPQPLFACSNEQNSNCTRWRVCGQDFQPLPIKHIVLSLSLTVQAVLPAMQSNLHLHMPLTETTTRLYSCTPVSALPRPTWYNHSPCYRLYPPTFHWFYLINTLPLHSFTNSTRLPNPPKPTVTHMPVLNCKQSHNLYYSMAFKQAILIHTWIIITFICCLAIHHLGTVIHPGPLSTHTSPSFPDTIYTLHVTHNSTHEPSLSLNRTCPLCTLDMPRVKPHLTECKAIPPLYKDTVAYYDTYVTITVETHTNPVLECASYRLWNKYWNTIKLNLGNHFDTDTLCRYYDFYLVLKFPHWFPHTIKHCKLSPCTSSMPNNHCPSKNPCMWICQDLNLYNCSRDLFTLCTYMLSMQITEPLISYLTPFINIICYLTLFFYTSFTLYKAYQSMYVPKLLVPNIFFPDHYFRLEYNSYVSYLLSIQFSTTTMLDFLMHLKLPQVRLLPSSTHPTCAKTNIPMNIYEHKKATVFFKSTCPLSITVSLILFAFCHTQHSKTVYT